MVKLPRQSVYLVLLLAMSSLFSCKKNKEQTRQITDFNSKWYFHLGDLPQGPDPNFDHQSWRQLKLPHDWSIEGEFDPEHPAGVGGGALPGGIGWYRKSFKVDKTNQNKLAFVQFEGIYWNSEVWINGQSLGKRPNGYISFEYELTPYLYYGDSANVIAVKVDNSQQPNSRWYSGSGIYRNTRLVFTDSIHVDHWGTFITTPEVKSTSALVNVETIVQNTSTRTQTIILHTDILDAQLQLIAESSTQKTVEGQNDAEIEQQINVNSPQLWSVDHPHLYQAISKVEVNGEIVDHYQTTFGIRDFKFDTQGGFTLNGVPVKIRGVCNHHDLGCLGAAFNLRAKERQLELLKKMGVNAIRTAHNPPAPQLLDLCDQMGFIVMDEAFDEWKKGKTKYGYAHYWDQWHQKDLQDLIRRDRNHPSVFVWSVGNEILEQWDSTGQLIVKELVDIVKVLDTTRPVTAACNPPSPSNHVIKPMVLDLIGYNYAHQTYEAHPRVFPDHPFIATETTSALATRGYYDLTTNSDSIRRWPIRWDIPFDQGNPNHTVSAYDHVSTPWGSTHEETLKIVEDHDYMSGMYIWTGFDYLGEPTPYGWPSRSSYFGIFDLAGFPKDSYYLYQSEWTKDTVLHIFPHWNWQQGDTIDVWAYFNTDEVELLLNGESLGKKSKQNGVLHAVWPVVFEPGTLTAVGYSNGKELITQEVKTAGKPASIQLMPDRNNLQADGKDLSFITVVIVDEYGVPVPNADNLIDFHVDGEAVIAGVDNGDPTSHAPFQANYRKAFRSKCLLVVQAKQKPGEVKITATSKGLESAEVNLVSKD